MRQGLMGCSLGTMWVEKAERTYCSVMLILFSLLQKLEQKKLPHSGNSANDDEHV